MTEPATSLPHVKRVSTLYIAAQDRFRLSAEMEDGQVHAMWLTQRMLRLLLEPLAPHLQQTQAKTPREKVRRSYVALMEKVAGKGGPPLSTAPVAEEWLISAIDVGFNGGAVRMLFQGEGGREAAMEIHAIKLRMWLGVLHRKSLKAGWPEQIWPQAVLTSLE